MIRAVLDTVVSGLFWQGSPRRVLRSGMTQQFKILASSELLAEYEELLAREKFSKLRAALGKTASEIVADLQRIAERIVAAEIPSNAVRDPKDIAILACAIGGKADFLVTGDHDLSDLSTYQDVTIVSPTRFLEILDTQQTSE